MNENMSTVDSLSDSNQYVPIEYHWFYQDEMDGRVSWTPFCRRDSNKIENAFLNDNITEDHVIATDGNRYDVYLKSRTRVPVYWSHAPYKVRRCSWFCKKFADNRYIPYEEDLSETLENEYQKAFMANEWHHQVHLSNGERIEFHGPNVLVHFTMAPSPDTWGNNPQASTRPRVVKRGLEDFEIEEGEADKVDHLLFMVHGVGAGCDLRFRPLEVVVDDVRLVCRQLVQSHYASSCTKGVANKIEVLPIRWHDKLHSDDTGVDKKLSNITLESIPRLRNFINDTILDILFYTSPIYCQKIISAVASEMNRLYELFNKRNPNFSGGVSVSGHSLGTLILFDILCHQKPAELDTMEEEEEGQEKPVTKPHPLHRRMSKRINYLMSVAGVGQPQLTYPHLVFRPNAFYALGSPIGMFVTIRGVDNLGLNFKLPTCASFFNIFHPYDPVAYRIEPLVNPELAERNPVLIPHHKGRKRMHLELKETMVRVVGDLKQKFMDWGRNTWSMLYYFIPQESSDVQTENQMFASANDCEETSSSSDNEPENEANINCGKLNNGRRIDYVLQEAPVEFFNDYIFAVQSHVCYWESEDTMLLILKDIYDAKGIQKDNQIPQQTMKIQPQ